MVLGWLDIWETYKYNWKCNSYFNNPAFHSDPSIKNA